MESEQTNGGGSGVVDRPLTVRGLSWVVLVMAVLAFICGLCVGVSFTRNHRESKASQQQPSTQATANDPMLAMQANMDALLKFKGEAEVVVSAIARKLDEVIATQNRMAQGVGEMNNRNVAALMLLDRTLAEKFTKDTWSKMVAKAQASLNKEVEAINKAKEAEKAEKK